MCSSDLLPRAGRCLRAGLRRGHGTILRQLRGREDVGHGLSGAIPNVIAEDSMKIPLSSIRANFGATRPAVLRGGVLIAALVAAALTLAGGAGHNGNAAAAEAAQGAGGLKTATVGLSAVDGALSTEGLVEAVRQSVVAAQVPGRILEVRVDRSEEHTSETPVTDVSRMPSSA